MATDQARPKVSIVTPSYNQAEFIGQTIESVLGQDYPDIEYIIVDGGSTDGTLDIIREYGDRLTSISEPDSGQSEAINKGFARATGEILSWLNSDDYYFPGAVTRAVDVLAANPDAGLVYGHCAKVDENGRQIELLKSPEFDRQLLFRNPNLIYQQSVFFRKSLLDRVALLDESLHFAMDYDLWVRMAKVADFKLVPEVLSAYRFSSHSKSVADSSEFWKEVDLIISKNGGLGLPLLYRILHRSTLVHTMWGRLRSPRLVRLRNRLFGFWEPDS